MLLLYSLRTVPLIFPRLGLPDMGYQVSFENWLLDDRGVDRHYMGYAFG